MLTCCCANVARSASFDAAGGAGDYDVIAVAEAGEYDIAPAIAAARDDSVVYEMLPPTTVDPEIEY